MGSGVFQGTVCPSLGTYSLRGWCQVAGKRPGASLGSVTVFGDTTNREKDGLPWPGLEPAVPAPCPRPRPLCRRLRASLSPWTMTEGDLTATRGCLAVGKLSGRGRHSWSMCLTLAQASLGFLVTATGSQEQQEAASSGRCPGLCWHHVGYCPVDHGRSRGQAQRHAAEERSPPGENCQVISTGRSGGTRRASDCSAISERLQSVQVVEAQTFILVLLTYCSVTL